MATITNFLAKPISNLSSTSKISPIFPQFLSRWLSISIKSLESNRLNIAIKATTAPDAVQIVKSDERVKEIHSSEDSDEALRAAKNRIVVVEYATSHNTNSSKIYPVMVDLSRNCGDVDFLLAMGDESEESVSSSPREKIEQVPHFSFYKKHGD